MGTTIGLTFGSESVILFEINATRESRLATAANADMVDNPTPLLPPRAEKINGNQFFAFASTSKHDYYLVIRVDMSTIKRAF